MGKKDGGAGDLAKQDRADEQARQDSIRQGTARINSIFDGGATGTGNKIDANSAYDPSKTYYNADGSIWSPPTGYTMGSDGAGGGMEINPAAAFSSAAKSGLFDSVSQNPGFNDAYYDKQRQNYIDYAKPQLDDQFADAQKQLTFALTRGNLLDSSARAQMEGDLKKQYDLSDQHIADQALTYETNARNSVEDARAQLIQMLNNTGDATGAASQALSRAQALSQPPSYSALGNMFADFTNTLGTQAALERANYYSGGQTGARYNTGLFAPNSGAVKVT